MTNPEDLQSRLDDLKMNDLIHDEEAYEVEDLIDSGDLDEAESRIDDYENERT